MAVPFLDLTRQYARIQNEVEPAVLGVLRTQYFILGPHGKTLEQETAAYLGTEQCVGCASGTDALLLSLRCLGLAAGEGVLTSSFTFFATAGAVHNAGGRPFFADIDGPTFNLDPEKVRAFLESDCERAADGRPRHRATGVVIRCLLPVHLYGLPADMDPLLKLAREFGLFVVEDTCQAFGAQYLGRKAGTLGDAGTYSFFPTKNFGGAGDGGLISVHDAEVAERLRRVRVHGSRERYYHDEIGYNSRLDEFQAAVLRVKLNHLDTWNAERNRVAAWYGEGLAGVPGIATPVVPEGRTHIYHQYVIRAERRDALKDFLQTRGIGSMIYYPVPLHQQKCFADLGYRTGDLPATERAAAEVLALPVFAELARTEVDEVCGAIREFYTGRG